YGVRVLAVDKAKDVFMAPRAIALDNEALRILQLAGLEAGDFEKCQSASKIDPRSASKIDPPFVKVADGSARPGGAGRDCAAGASAVR
ncbi:MAG TPA: hypothetical protein VEH77_00205, partial [Roseiarcus sp.]|nr:hypothetical protein [Roseiarcus sp.]